MATDTYCPDGEYPTVGLDAAELDQFADVSTADDQMLIYDQENEDAWIQADLCFTRESCV